MARPGFGTLLLAGVAAFGYYKYSKMTAAEKEQLKAKGRKFYEDNVPQNLRDAIAGRQPAEAQPAGGAYNGGSDGFTQM